MWNQCVEIFFYSTLNAPIPHPFAKEIQYMSGHCLDLSWNECLMSLFWPSCIYQKTTLWMVRFSEVSGWEGSQLIKNCELVVGRPSKLTLIANSLSFLHPAAQHILLIEGKPSQPPIVVIAKNSLIPSNQKKWKGVDKFGSQRIIQ